MKRYLLSFWFIIFVMIWQSGNAQENDEITLRDIWASGKFYPETMFGLEPMRDGLTYSVLEDSLLNVYDFETGQWIKTLLNTNTLIAEHGKAAIRMQDFSFSHDEQKLMIATETESIYRHSSKSAYYTYDFASKALRQVSANGKQQLASFSPDGNMLAFVRDNNLYLKYLDNESEVQLTTDGKVNSIINGTTDWVYEEEFGFTKAFFWSADSKKIAFYRFDESKVKEYQLEYFNGLYPEWYTYKYPKAGEENSKVDVLVYHLDTRQTVRMETGSENDQYIPRIKWSEDPGKLAVQRMNRLQNTLEIALYDVATGTHSTIYEEKNQYYIDITDNLFFLPNNKQFIVTSEKNGYNHIYLCSLEGKAEKQITSGEWDVTEVYGVNPVDYTVYYQSAETSPLDRNIYKISLKGKKARLSERPGTNSAIFSNNFNYFVNQNTTANTPYYITVNNDKGAELRIIQSNKEYNAMLQTLKLSPQTFFEIPDTSFKLPNGQVQNLWAWKILPPDFSPDKKYPVLFYVYGGPGSQTVTNSWGWHNYFWFQMLAKKGVIVVSVDNRGTGARGELFKKMTYKELGKYETADLIRCAKYFKALPYVDTTSIGIFGWSYGGYMSSLAITKGADVFTSAIAVAPVTNWRNYDNIYTERFMQRPQENASGYDLNSPVNYVTELKGSFLLVHGSTDDNVHYQNSMEMINALVKANKTFDVMIYPNRNHGISGGNARLHLYEKMNDFIDKNLLHQ